MMQLNQPWYQGLTCFGLTVGRIRPVWISLPGLIFLILTPIFLAVLVNLLGVHWADREADATVGKNTLVVRLSSRVRMLHFTLTGLIYIFTIALFHIIPWQVVMAILLTIPLAIWAYLSFERSPTSSSFLMSAVMIFAAVGWILS